MRHSYRVTVVAPGDINQPHAGDVEYAAALVRMLESNFDAKLHCFEGHNYMRPRVYYYMGLPKWLLHFTTKLVKERGIIVVYHHLGISFWCTCIKLVFKRKYKLVPYVANIESISKVRYAGASKRLNYFLNLFMWRFTFEQCKYVLADSNAVPDSVFPSCYRLGLPVMLVDTEQIGRGAKSRQRVRSSLGIGTEEKIIGVIGPFHAFNKPSITFVKDNINRFLANARFLMIGDISPADKFYHDRVRFVGRVDDLYGYISACDCVLIPRFVHHGSPMGKMVNAIACGVPVVTNDLEGMKLQPGKDVVLGSLEELPSLVNQLLADGRLALEIGLNGQKHIQEYYSMKQFREPLIKFLHAAASEA
jgi:glycosyltransferase involved in cell wall biosynthesis